MKKRSVVVVVLLMALAAPAFADHNDSHLQDGGYDPNYRELIVLGTGIGKAQLGMSRVEFQRVASRMVCAVTAEFDRNGRATKIKTESGGPCELEGLAVGNANRLQVWSIFGKPDRITEDRRYSPPPNAKSDVAYWERYSGRGIEFRFLVTSYEGGFEESLLQAIAVFPARR